MHTGYINSVKVNLRVSVSIYNGLLQSGCMSTCSCQVLPIAAVVAMAVVGVVDFVIIGVAMVVDMLVVEVFGESETISWIVC